MARRLPRHRRTPGRSHGVGPSSLAALPLLATAVVGLLAGSPGRGQSAPGALETATVLARETTPGPPKPPAATPLVELDAASRDKLLALEEWNRRGRGPVKNGLRRSFPPRQVRWTESRPAPRPGSAAATVAADSQAWSGWIRVRGAGRLRLHLDEVILPPGTRFRLYGRDEERSFGLELLHPTAGLWTPSVAGDTVALAVKLPAGAPRPLPGRVFGFFLDEVLELLAPGVDATSRNDGYGSSLRDGCRVDPSCQVEPQELDSLASAVARIDFVLEEGGFSCTATLLNDTDPSTLIPYLLTARHCISTDAVASTVEAFWDYRTPGCSLAPPPLSQVPRTQGATLLAQGPMSDFALLRLKSPPPAPRLYLGWDADPKGVRTGDTLRKLHHPGGEPLSFVEAEASSDFELACKNLAPHFLVSRSRVGATAQGSSGAPVINDAGQLVGAHRGKCGFDLRDPCDPVLFRYVDGAFSATFPAVAQFLAPDPDAPHCQTDSRRACFQDGRFEVTVSWQNDSGARGEGGVALAAEDSAIFWFFDPLNWALLVKVLDGCALNGHYWVLGAAVTNQSFTLQVVDQEAEAARTYSHPGGRPASPILDTAAFATCP